MDSPKQRRKYQSPRRKEQAQETRQRILAAALKLFSSRGYSGATMEEIAQEASVAPLTIFAAFGNKRSLLSELIRVSVGGDDRSISLLERPGPRSVFTEPDPHAKIHRFAEDISEILERVAPIFEIMRTAAKTEPEIDLLLHKILEERLRNLGAFVAHLAPHSGMRDATEITRATETVWAIASPEIYRLLTTDRGWSKMDFAKWLGETLSSLWLP